MIISRTPLRISLGGGGTDLPSYYQEHEGFLIAAAIDKYVYITIHRTFEQKLVLKYSKLENVKKIDEVTHPIFKESLKLLGYEKPYLEIASMADISAGTGLGSSGSFTVGLLKALHHDKKNIMSTRNLAEQACHIELDILNEPIGKQDQYIAAYGGVTCFQYQKNGTVDVQPLKASEETLANLEESLLLFFTGTSRSASNILKDQNDKTKQSNSEMIENLHFIKDIGLKSKSALEHGNLEEFAKLMHTHWLKKRERSKGMSDSAIDQAYELGMKNGALGGKLIGAGGGGFLMFFASDRTKLRHAMRQNGLQEVRFRFDFEGSKIITS